MTTTIVPGSGAGCLFTQQGIGTSPGYSALDLRRSNVGGLQEGVLGSGASAQDFMVQQRIAGANMQVEITSPAGGMAAVQGDTISGQGLYDIPVHSANILETIGTADLSNPRIDQVILEAQDNVLDASGGNQARTRVVPGTATAGATLTNRTGVGALPGSALLLADVLVGAGVGSITNAVIRDRRKWARGAYVRVLRNANAAAGNDYTTSSTTLVDIDATNVAPRIECSGAPVRISLKGRVSHAVATNLIGVSFLVDGAGVDGATGPLYQGHTSNAPVCYLPLDFAWDFVPVAGSHVIKPQYLAGSGGAVTLEARAIVPLTFVVEETIRQNVANNTVTTG